MENNIREYIEKITRERITEIRTSADTLDFSGTAYYVSNSGSDENDGLSPETAWKTLKKVSDAEFNCNDAVLFCRGDIFRGSVNTRSGVSYGAYGEGDYGVTVVDLK